MKCKLCDMQMQRTLKVIDPINDWDMQQICMARPVDLVKKTLWIHKCFCGYEDFEAASPNVKIP